MASLLEQFLSQPSECHQKTKLEQPPHAHAHTTAASRRRYPFALAAHPSSSRILFPGRSDRKKINLLTPMDQQIPLPDSILDDDQFYSLVSFYVSKISDTRRNDVETISSNQTTGPQSAVWTGTANHNVMLPAIREDFVEGIENPLHPLQTKVSTAVLSAGSGEFNLFHEHGIILGEGNHPDELETIAKYLRDSLSDVEVMADAQHHPCASFAYAIKGIGTSSACLFSKNRFRQAASRILKGCRCPKCGKFYGDTFLRNRHKQKCNGASDSGPELEERSRSLMDKLTSGDLTWKQVFDHAAEGKFVPRHYHCDGTKCKNPYNPRRPQPNPLTRPPSPKAIRKRQRKPKTTHPRSHPPRQLLPKNGSPSIEISHSSNPSSPNPWAGFPPPPQSPSVFSISTSPTSDQLSPSVFSPSRSAASFSPFSVGTASTVATLVDENSSPITTMEDPSPYSPHPNSLYTHPHGRNTGYAKRAVTVAYRSNL